LLILPDEGSFKQVMQFYTGFSGWQRRASIIPGILLLIGISTGADAQIKQAGQGGEIKGASSARARPRFQFVKRGSGKKGERVVFGVLRDEQGRGVARALVGLMDQTETVIGEAVTDAAGSYFIAYGAVKDTALSVSFVYDGQEVVQGNVRTDTSYVRVDGTVNRVLSIHGKEGAKSGGYVPYVDKERDRSVRPRK
jgi:hypothetical protein